MEYLNAVCYGGRSHDIAEKIAVLAGCFKGKVFIEKKGRRAQPTKNGILSLRLHAGDSIRIISDCYPGDADKIAAEAVKSFVESSDPEIFYDLLNKIAALGYKQNANEAKCDCY